MRFRAQHVTLLLRPHGCGGAQHREGGVAGLELGYVLHEGAKVIVVNGEEDTKLQCIGVDHAVINGGIGTLGMLIIHICARHPIREDEPRGHESLLL